MKTCPNKRRKMQPRTITFTAERFEINIELVEKQIEKLKMIQKLGVSDFSPLIQMLEMLVKRAKKQKVVEDL